MAKMYSSKHIIKIFEYHGFNFVSQRGGHKKFRSGSRIVIVPDPRKEIPWVLFVLY